MSAATRRELKEIEASLEAAETEYQSVSDRLRLVQQERANTEEELRSQNSRLKAMLDEIATRKVRERPAEHPATYRLWRQEYVNMTGRWIYNAYVVEPSGQVLQLNGFLMDAPDAPVWNISLCGQGNCSLVS